MIEEANQEKSLFIDAESGYHNAKYDAYSKRIIVMEIIKNINKSRSQELRGGYWMTRTSENGETTLTWIQDQRDLYCNAIQALYLNTYCEIKRRPLKKKEGINYNEIIDAAYAQIQNKIKEFLLSTAKNDKAILCIDMYNGEDKLKAENFKQELVALHDELYLALHDWLKMINYYETEGIIDQ